MDEFRIEGKNGYIQVCLDKLFEFPNNISFAGGYDGKWKLEIKSSSYYVNGEIYASTGEIYKFYCSLKECYNKLNGTAELLIYDHNLQLAVRFDKLGNVIIYGEYVEKVDEDNRLIFEIISDQSYMHKAINDLEKLVNKYGDLRGINR